MKRFVSVFGIFSLAMLILTIPLVVWLFHTFTVVKTNASEEFLVLRSEQAKECFDGGGCAVYSGRERNKELNAFLQYLIQSGYIKQRGGI
jgi:hypothetical protein